MNQKTSKLKPMCREQLEFVSAGNMPGEDGVENSSSMNNKLSGHYGFWGFASKPGYPFSSKMKDVQFYKPRFGSSIKISQLIP